jgi:hypothetical protein
LITLYLQIIGETMKTFRQFLAAAVLTLMFSFSCIAGDIQFPGVTNSPPPRQSSITGDISFPGTTSTGDIQAPDAVALDPVTEAALSLLQSLMSLF